MEKEAPGICDMPYIMRQSMSVTGILYLMLIFQKISEGKHYNVAMSHAAKKLVRVIFHLQKTGQLYAS